MSTQRPTTPSFLLRAPMLLVALGLGALLWSCESEQTGYEVTLPLIGPIEFDETSCDISGDICSTDDDCFDEDGLFVGPCTKTLTPLEPITVAVSLSPSSPRYTLPAIDTGRWVGPLAVLQNTGSNPVVLTTENFSVTGGPVTLSVRPFSRNGLILGRDADYEPVNPSSCTFTLDDSSTGEDYSNGISTCLRDWVAQNGAPLEFDIEVTSSAGAGAPASAALKSGFGLKQAPNYFVNGDDKWQTDRECEGQKDTEVLDAVGEGSDFFDLLTCKELEFGGSGSCTEPIEIFGVAVVYDACRKSLATGSLGSAVRERIELPRSPPRYTVTLKESEDFEPLPGDIPVFFPDGAGAFVDALLLAASGECLSGDEPPDPGTGEDPMGYAEVEWEHCYAGDADPIPVRTGDIEYGASGFCPVDQGAGATEGSGQ